MMLRSFALVILFTLLSVASVSALPAQPAAFADGVGSEGASYLRRADHQVAAVTHRLATRGTRFCTPTHAVTGMLLHHLGEYSPRDREAAHRQFRLRAGPGILAIVEGSAAAEAGLRAGDVLLSINGTPLPSPSAAAAERDDKKRRRLMEAVDAQLENQLRSGPARLRVSRGDQLLDVVMKPRLGCLARGRLARSRQPNAFADGRYAIVTTRLLEFVRSDDELAIVIAHELAHNMLGHPDRLKEQKVPNGIFRGFGRNAAHVLKTEEEADQLGIRLVWAAGYDVSAAIPFWRRLYATYDPLPVPKLFRTHPSLGARERMINETIAELRASESQLGANGPQLGKSTLPQR
jgi:hypothetical protein